LFSGDKAEGKGQTGDESEDRRKKRLQAKRGLSRRIWDQSTQNAAQSTTVGDRHVSFKVVTNFGHREIDCPSVVPDVMVGSATSGVCFLLPPF
jgi:hypothetical protein